MTALLFQLLSRRGWCWYAACLAAIASLPSLSIGLVSDDWMHRSVLLGAGPFPPSPRPTWELFSFVLKGVAHSDAWREAGSFPGGAVPMRTWLS